MVFWTRIIEIALIFSKGLHPRLGSSDFGRGLCGQSEAELVEQQVVNLLGLGASDRGFERLDPRRAFLRVRQERLPKGVESEAIPGFQSDPAAAPLAWTGQFDVFKTELECWMFE